jgi:hypothetical protein
MLALGSIIRGPRRLGGTSLPSSPRSIRTASGKPASEPRVGEMQAITVGGVKQQRRVHNSRVVAERDMGDGWSNRGAFAGDAAAFIALKRAGIASGNPRAAE